MTKDEQKAMQKGKRALKLDGTKWSEPSKPAFPKTVSAPCISQVAVPQGSSLALDHWSHSLQARSAEMGEWQTQRGAQPTCVSASHAGSRVDIHISGDAVHID